MAFSVPRHAVFSRLALFWRLFFGSRFSVLLTGFLLCFLWFARFYFWHFYMFLIYFCVAFALGFVSGSAVCWLVLARRSFCLHRVIGFGRGVSFWAFFPRRRLFRFRVAVALFVFRVRLVRLFLGLTSRINSFFWKGFIKRNCDLKKITIQLSDAFKHNFVSSKTFRFSLQLS